MYCNDYRNNLTSYLENELSTEEKKATLAHEESCVECSSFKKEYLEVIGSLSKLAKVRTSPNFEKILHQKLEDLSQESLINKIGEFLVPSSIGVRTAAVGFVALLLVLSGSYLFYNSSFSGGGEGMPVLSSPSFIEKKVVESSSETKAEDEDVKSAESEKSDEEEEMNSAETEFNKK